MPLKKIMNSAGTYVDEVLNGLVLANPAMKLGGESRRAVWRESGVRPGHVGIASGGGSGHLPLFVGYVGEGLLASCAVGNVFEGPNLVSCMDAINGADGGAGVLLLFGNYGGDKMNFAMAAEMLEGDGIKTRTVLGIDDIASAGPEEVAKRRGVAGIIYAYKIAGAAADAGRNLDEVARIAQKAIDNTRTIGVALTPCQLPSADRPTFELADDEIEMGMGIHGERGIWRGKMRDASALVEEMLQRLGAELSLRGGMRISVLVNGLGATPLEELFLVYGEVCQRLEQLGVQIAMPLVGNYVTSMEMAGMSLSIIALDEELEQFLTAPASCPFWKVS